MDAAIERNAAEIKIHEEFYLLAVEDNALGVNKFLSTHKGFDLNKIRELYYCHENFHWSPIHAAALCGAGRVVRQLLPMVRSSTLSSRCTPTHQMDECYWLCLLYTSPSPRDS